MEVETDSCAKLGKEIIAKARREAKMDPILRCSGFLDVTSSIFLGMHT